MNEYIKGVCRIGQGALCCRYLVMGPKGFGCMKANPSDKQVLDNTWGPSKVAQGDNCEGQQDLNNPTKQVNPQSDET